MGQLATREAKEENLKSWLMSPGAQAQFAKAIRTSIDPKTVVRLALSTWLASPKLQQCTKESFAAAIMEALQLGLEPHNASGQAYLVPYGTTCKLIIGYRGLILLAHRSGFVASVQARNVYENEPFVLDWGNDPPITHTPLPPSKRGEFKGSYARIALVKGGVNWEWMWAEEIEAVQARSAAGRDGPWTHKEDKEEMRRKSVLRRGLKYVPSSSELQRALGRTEAVDAGLEQGLEGFNVVDVPGTSTPKAAGSLEDLTPDAPTTDPPAKRRGRPPKRPAEPAPPTSEPAEPVAEAPAADADVISGLINDIAKLWNQILLGQRGAALKNLGLKVYTDIAQITNIDDLRAIKEAFIGDASPDEPT